MAASKGRYEPLYEEDNDRASMLEKRRSVFLESRTSTLSPTSTLPAYRRTLESLGPRRRRETLPLDRFFNFCARIPSGVKWLIVIVTSGLPFTAFLLICIFAIPHNKTIGPNGTYLETAIWTMSSWAAFIIMYGLVSATAALLAAICRQSIRLMKYEDSGRALTFRVAALLWAAVSYAIIPQIFPHVTHWVWWVHKVFEFVMIALSIFLAQGIILEFLSIRYIQGWLGPRSQRASDELETIRMLQSLVMPNKKAAGPSMMSRMYTSFFDFSAIHVLYQEISQGKGDEEKWMSYATILWNNIRNGRDSVTRFDLETRLRSMGRHPGSTYDLFTQLDASGDSSVTQDEVEKLVQRIGHQLNLRTKAHRGIDSILRKLDIILFVIVIVIVVIVYFEVFNPNEIANFKSFLMSISLFGLAISGPLLEFINNCIFVFGKHPYDVGDFIEAKGKKLMVTHIGLTHTNFEEALKPNSSERGLFIQMSNASLTAEPIVNWTRTAELVLEKKAVEEANAGAALEKDGKIKDELRELVLLQSAKLQSEGIEIKKKDEEEKDGEKKDKKEDEA